MPQRMLSLSASGWFYNYSTPAFNLLRYSKYHLIEATRPLVKVAQNSGTAIVFFSKRVSTSVQVLLNGIEEYRNSSTTD